MKFQITRPNGRSNAQVIIDLVTGKDPGITFSYEVLGKALSKGSTTDFDRSRIVRIVNSANRRLLIERKRRLINIANVGYKLALASEHLPVACADKKRADKQFNKGLLTLRNVNWDEMDKESRKAHEGHLMIMEGLHQNQVAMERRMARVEATIRAITGPRAEEAG